MVKGKKQNKLKKRQESKMSKERKKKKERRKDSQRCAAEHFKRSALIPSQSCSAMIDSRNTTITNK